MRRSFTLWMLFVLLIHSLAVPTGAVSAATYRNHIARVPETPTSQQSVRVWMNSDTAFGETAYLEYNTGSTYVMVPGVFDTSGPAGANWRADIPPQPNNTFVRYQLLTQNQSGQFYGYTGFNWSYTVSDGDIQWDGLKHDTFDSYYRSPFGAVPAGTQVTLRFRTFPLDVDGVSVRVYSYDPATTATAGPADYPMSYLEDRLEDGVNYAIWTVTLTTPSSPAVWYYKFRVTDQLDVDFYSDSYADDHDNLNQGGPGATSDDEPFPAFQLTVYDPAFQTPDWLKNAVVYQIFPDRFRNGDPSNDYCVPGSTSGCPVFYGDQTVVPRTTWNEEIHDPRQAGPYLNTYGTQFYGGDLRGILEKLDYLQGVGVNTLYLTPIFKGQSNHRYDTDNYLEIDPALGTQADFDALVAEMDRRGMYLVLDGVFNHTSSDSIYFDRYQRYATDGACESLSSTYRSWYEFFNTDAPCGPGDYAGWFGFDSLAVLTDSSSQVRDFIYRSGGQNVIKFWYGEGVGGWRFDVADEISHNWWRDFRPYAKGYNPSGPLIGEVWYDATRFLLGDQLDSVMNYRFRKNALGFARGGAEWRDNDNNGSNNILPLAPSELNRAMQSIREDYPPQAFAAMLNLLDSHDTNRALYVLTLLGDNGLNEAKQRLQVAALLQFTTPGAPMVYYGDEAAIDSPSKANGVNGPEDDPYNRAPYPWADEAGNPDVYGPADAGMIAFYSKLAHLRHEHTALRSGEFSPLLTGDTSPSGSDNNTYAFARTAGSDTVVVAVSNGSAPNSAALVVGSYFPDGTVLQDALSGVTYTVSGGLVNVNLAPRSGQVLLPAPAQADITQPGAAIALNPETNAAGWTNSPVTATLTGADSGAGMKELRYWIEGGLFDILPGSSGQAAFTQDGQFTLNLFAVDNALNFSPLVTRTFGIDRVAPSAALTGRTPAANTQGWNNTPVTITWSCADALSGPQAAGGSTVVSVEGSGLSVTLACTDLAGNGSSQTEGNINIDLTSPSVSVQGVSDGATYTLGSVPAASCQTTDALSGVAAQAALTLSGGSPDGTGTFTATCAGAQDAAGNAAPPVSVSYTVSPAPVLFPFSGFLHPVDNLPVMNTVRAGSVIPIKFSLGGDYGLNIFAAGSPASQRITCDSSAPTDAIEQTASAGGSTLTYDPVTQQYTYIWRTERPWANTCRQLMLTFTDGQTYTANFRFSR